MASQVTLRLKVSDVYGKPISEKIDVMLRHRILSQFKRKSASGSKEIEVAGLFGDPQGDYRLDVDAPSYQFVTDFIRMKSSGITSLSRTLPVDPSKVKSVNFPIFSKLDPDLGALLELSDKVLTFEGLKGKDLYDGLDPIRKAGMLNIAKKTTATGLGNGRTVFSYIQELKELRGDRFFAVVGRDLREETKNSIDEGIFHVADQSMHHPPTGFSAAGSFKTSDRYGNLQLTFFAKGEDWVADIDIDDAGGLEHVFQVLRNKISGRPTHPYSIHEILVQFQQLDPGYTFTV